MKKVTASATMLAATGPTPDGIKTMLDTYKATGALDSRKSALDLFGAESIAEYAGRGCYDAYGARNMSTASIEGYLRNILNQNHLSVLEHVSATIELKGVSRSATHEIVRHRHFSFSQQSQRYVSPKDFDEIVIPPSLRDDAEAQLALVNSAKVAVDEAAKLAERMESDGFTRKEANEAARAFLPQCMATHIVVTGNARSWIEFITKRLHPAADKELQDIAEKILKQLEDEFPVIFKTNRDVWGAGNEQLAPHC